MSAMKIKKQIASLLVLTVLLTVSAQNAFSSSDTASTDAVTLKSLIQEALKENPSIKSAKYRWGAAIERLPQVNSLPDPWLSFTYFPEPIETRLGPNDSKFMFTQAVPYLKKLSVKESIAGSDARIAELEYKREIRSVITAVSESYFELLYLQNALETTSNQKDILTEITKIGAADYAADSATLNDVLTAQGKLAQLNYDYLLIVELMETERARLNSLLNRSPDAELGGLENLTAVVKHELDELYDIAKDNREEIEILNAGIAKMDEMTELAKLSSYPDFKFSLLYSQIGEPDGMQPVDAGRDAYGVTVGLTIPIWGEKNRAGVSEQMLKKRALIEKKNNSINMTNSKINSLYFKMNNAKRLMELYSGTLIPQAKETMLKAQEWYKQRGTSFSQFLETQSVWLNFKLAYQRAAADHNKYAVRLQNLLGINLDYADPKAKEGE